MVQLDGCPSIAFVYGATGIACCPVLLVRLNQASPLHFNEEK